MPLVAGLFYGIKPAVTAIVLQATHRIGSRALRNYWMWAIAAAAFIAIFALNVPFPAVIACAALIGYAGGRIAPDKFKVGGGWHGKADKSFGPALIDDHTPTPEHAKFRWFGLVKVVVVGGLLWALPMALLTANYGWDHTLTQMGWFFTKAALLTFGGAYAVLPYVYLGAVGHYGWVTPPQMIDGLALAKRHRGRYHGGGLRWIHRRLCACAVRRRQSVPCRCCRSHAGDVVHLPAVFHFYFRRRTAGGGDARRHQVHRAIDCNHRGRGRRHFESGRVLCLPRSVAEEFLRHFDWISALIALAAVIVILRYKRGVMEVIAACAVAGLILKMLL